MTTSPNTDCGNPDETGEAVTVTTRPWPHWSPGAEEHRTPDRGTYLVIGPATRANGDREIEFCVGVTRRPSTNDPDTLRAFGDAFHHWATILEHELAQPPIGQTELGL